MSKEYIEKERALQLLEENASDDEVFFAARAIEAEPAVPQEMSAREFGDAFRRYYFEDFLPSNDTYDTEIDTYAHCFEL